jgi:acetolactate synthase I/II/III large subunit
MKVRVADYIAERLVEWNVRKVFMLSGGGMMHLVDSVGRNSSLEAVCNHHEQCSAIAADAQARISGNIAVCYATSGPGATNVLTGLVGAWQDSSPVLFLTGQSKLSQTIYGSKIEGLRQFGTFEVDIVPIVKPACKYAVLLDNPNRVRYELEKAVHLATTGRPGPVLIDIPLDIQGAQVEIEELEGFVPEEKKPAGINGLDSLVELLGNAKRPLLLTGVGVRAGGAVEPFKQLIEKLQIPVVTTQLGKDLMPYQHGLFVGHAGPKGDRAGNLAVQAADLIIAIGCSLHSQTTGWENELFAPTAKKIQVDIDEANNKRQQVGVDVFIHADVRDFLIQLNQTSLPGGKYQKWVDICQEWKNKYPVFAEPHTREASSVNYYDFAKVLGEILGDNANIVTDAGSAFYVMGQAFQMKEGQRFVSSGSLGAMGFAVPAATGAATANDNVTICVTGDGSLMTNIHELAVIKKNSLNVKLFVLNNDGYLSIRNTQRDFFNGMYVGTGPESGVFIPSLESQALSYGLPYLRCETTDKLEGVIKAALDTAGPVFVEIIAPRDQKIIPSVTSKKLDNGKMVSMPIEHMAPFLEDGVVESELKKASEI